MHGGRWIDRRIEIVAERSAQRLLVAFLHRNVVDDRRPQAARLERQHLGQGLCLGLQPLHAFFRFRYGLARHFQVAARNVVRGFGGDRRGFGFGQRGLRPFDRSGERSIVGAMQRRQFTLDCGDLADEILRRVRLVRVRHSRIGCAGRRGRQARS